MTEQAFSQLLGTVYATFGRPAPQGDVRTVIWLRVKHIPDEACAWIAAKLCDEDRLPQNMGRAVAQAWDAWLLAHPERAARRQACPDCVNGWLDCWSERGGQWRHWMAPCPHCRSRDGLAETRRQLAERGVVVMPAGYRGGPVMFDREHGFGVLWREPPSEGCGNARWDGVIPDMQPEPRRLRALSAAEHADAAGF